MALLFMDSFDHYVTADITKKWGSMTGSGTGVISPGNGRHGSASFRLTTSSATLLQKSLTAPTGSNTIIFGMAVKTSALSALKTIASVIDASADRDMVFFQLGTDGSIIVNRSGTFSIGNLGGFTVIATSGVGVISAGVYNYIEGKVFVHNTIGSVIVRVNGIEVINATNLDTSPMTTAQWTGMWMGMSGGSTIPIIDIDDVYMMDDTGPAPWNNFLGDVRVDARLPTGAGATTGWTPTGGVNWANVDDTTPDDDTTYNTALSANLTDTFVVEDVAVAGAPLYGIQLNTWARKTDAGPALVVPVIRHSGVDNVGTNLGISSSGYIDSIAIYQTNPGTGIAWTEAGFNAAEFGYKRTL